MMNSKTTFSLVVAGSTKYTQLLAKTLVNSGIFELQFLLVPPPKPVGRKQIVTPSAPAVWGTAAGIEVVEVSGQGKKAISPELIKGRNRPDFLLIVDFGYLIPDWLLEWPRIAPINIHPSRLPEWRGATPAQMVLLSGATSSAVTIMVPNSHLDQGDIITQLELPITPTMTKDNYYQTAFQLTAEHLGQILTDFARGKLVAQPQSELSPTPPARQMTKDDGFLPWELVVSAVTGQPRDEKKLAQWAAENYIVQIAQTRNAPLPAEILDRAIRAFSPWPAVWTLKPVPDNSTQVPKRMKILAAHLENRTTLVIDQVMIEGKNQAQPFDLGWLK